MKTQEMNKSKRPVVIIDDSLERFKGRNLFPEKLKKANEFLAKAGVPDLNKLK